MTINNEVSVVISNHRNYSQHIKGARRKVCLLSLFRRFLSKLIRDRWEAMYQIQNGSQGAQNEVRGLEAGEKFQMKCSRFQQDKADVWSDRVTVSVRQTQKQ